MKTTVFEIKNNTLDKIMNRTDFWEEKISELEDRAREAKIKCIEKGESYNM